MCLVFRSYEILIIIFYIIMITYTYLFSAYLLEITN